MSQAVLIHTFEPRPGESAGGFLHRALTLNGSSVREALELIYGASRRILTHDAAGRLAAIVGVGEQWLLDRLPAAVRSDRWGELELFKVRWRDEWTWRGSRQQVCISCIEEGGLARLEWDLYAYSACHLHGTVLLDHCELCGRTISIDRPRMNVCSCGCYLATERRPADPIVLSWSAWLSDSLERILTDRSPQDSCFELLRGLSLDGAYRMVIAFGGGSEQLRGNALDESKRGLTSAVMHEFTAASLRTLTTAGQVMWKSKSARERCSNSLGLQCVRGITAFDRDHAHEVMKALGVQAKRRVRNIRLYDQLRLEF